MRPIGINFDAIGGLSDEDYVKTVAELGFNNMFTQVTPSEEKQASWADLFAKHGITYETIHAPWKNINAMWLPGEDGEAAVQMLTNAIDRCALVGAPIAVVHLSSGLTPPPVTDLGRERFTRVVEHAQKKGIVVAFENQRFLSNISWAFEAFSPADSVAFCWDCGHESCFAHGREYMPLFGDRLVCTHIHDNSGEFDADTHLIPFDGMFNYHRFAEQINKVGYNGSLTLEVCEPNSKNYVGMDPYAYLEKAANAAKKLRAIVDGN